MGTKKTYYKQVGTYRNWGIYQYRTTPDFVGNMDLKLQILGSDRGDLEGDISETMRSTLSAFEKSITKGTRPSKLDPPEPLSGSSPRLPSTPWNRRLKAMGRLPKNA